MQPRVKQRYLQTAIRFGLNLYEAVVREYRLIRENLDLCAIWCIDGKHCSAEDINLATQDLIRESLWGRYAHKPNAGLVLVNQEVIR